jgi:hypothetical protein
MRQATLMACAVGCGAVAVLFGKTPDTDWGSLLMSVLFAGSAGFLLAAA